MEYTKLGSSGLDASQIYFGTSRFNKKRGDGAVETDRLEAHERGDNLGELFSNDS